MSSNIHTCVVDGSSVLPGEELAVCVTERYVDLDFEVGTLF